MDPVLRIYVAASWRTPTQPAVVERLQAEGHDVYDFRAPRFGSLGRGFAWSDIDPAWQQWSPEAYREALSHPTAVHGLAADVAGLHWANTLVLLQPSGRSAALECGWALGAGLSVAVLLAPGQEPELMLGMAHKLCVDLEELVGWLDRERQRVTGIVISEVVR